MIRKNWTAWEEYGVIVLTVAAKLAEQDQRLQSTTYANDIAKMLRWQIEEGWITEKNRMEQADAFIAELGGKPSANYESLADYLYHLGANVYDCDEVPHKFWVSLVARRPVWDIPRV
jgi:hypothetical protein